MFQPFHSFVSFGVFFNGDPSSKFASDAKTLKRGIQSNKNVEGVSDKQNSISNYENLHEYIHILRNSEKPKISFHDHFLLFLPSPKIERKKESSKPASPLTTRAHIGVCFFHITMKFLKHLQL